MIYRMDENKDNIRILGEKFVKNNVNKSKLIINNKKLKLKEFFKIKDIKEDKLKIKLYLDKDVFNKGYIFKNCDLLLQFSIFYEEIIFENENEFIEYEENEALNEFNIDSNDSDIHPLYKNLKFNTIFSEEQISKKSGRYTDNSTIIYMNNELLYTKKNYSVLTEMFSNCLSLSSLPEISKWDTSKVVDMSGMFYNCISLTNLNGISNWNIDNVQNISFMFFQLFKIIYFARYI